MYLIMNIVMSRAINKFMQLRILHTKLLVIFLSIITFKIGVGGIE